MLEGGVREIFVFPPGSYGFGGFGPEKREGWFGPAFRGVRKEGSKFWGTWAYALEASNSGRFNGENRQLIATFQGEIQ